jgi:hypothetical protein
MVPPPEIGDADPADGETGVPLSFSARISTPMRELKRAAFNVAVGSVLSFEIVGLCLRTAGIWDWQKRGDLRLVCPSRGRGANRNSTSAN